MVKKIKVLQGNVVLLELDPTLGNEQKGTLPALVVSIKDFNKVQRMVFICPITNSKRTYPTHVEVGEGLDVTGHIMCEQLRAIDKDVRIIKKIGRVNSAILSKVLSIINAIMYED